MKIYTDGGEDKYCFVIPEKNIAKIFEKKGITNNEAEYLAVIEALNFVEENSNVLILSDSKLIVNQIKMEWHIKEERLREMFKKIIGIIDEKKLKFKIEWIPREENKAGKVLG
jgi:ribonuclease HI